MSQSSSRVFTTAHARFIALVGNCEQDIRGLIRIGRWQLTSVDVQGQSTIILEMNRRQGHRHFLGFCRVFNRPNCTPFIASHELGASVDHYLRRVDTVETKTFCVSLLAFAIFVQGIGIPPSDTIPVIHVLAQNDELRSTDRLQPIQLF